MYIGFDIGGSSIKAALVQKNKIVGTRYERLPKKFADLVKVVTEIKKDFTNNKAIKINGVGFSVAGALDKAREKVLTSYNIPYLNNKELLKIFQRSLRPFPVRMERDAFCFLIAEAKVGMGKRYKDIYYLTLGTGIGGAYMRERKLVIGHHGAAGEVGHTIVNFEKKVHWEDLAANRFIKSHLNTYFSEAKQRALAGNPKAKKVFAELGDNIGLGIANIINNFDPEVVIISGGLAAAKKLILPGIKKAVKEYVISPEARRTKILWSKLGRFGGALGAALLFEK
jgi:glucokinase